MTLARDNKANKPVNNTITKYTKPILLLSSCDRPALITIGKIGQINTFLSINTE